MSSVSVSELNRPPKILFLDIETFPNVGYTWGKYDQSVIEFLQQFCIATYSAKWLDNNKVFAAALPDYKGYKAGSYDDEALVKDLHKLLDEADIIVAHNGKDFDIRMIQGRFIVHKLNPPAPFKFVDTKLAAKKVARWNSYKLNDIGELLGEGKKIKTDFDLWKGCINGDKKAWNQMVTYNKQDVLLLERVYKRLLPFIVDHPNLGLWLEDVTCPKCGSTNLQSRGVARTSTRLYRRFQCKKCGGWCRSSKSNYAAKQVNNVA